MTPPLCKDCVSFFDADPENRPPTCLYRLVDPVRGETRPSIPYCYEMRRCDGECGREGRLFEKKDEA